MNVFWTQTFHLSPMMNAVSVGISGGVGISDASYMVGDDFLKILS